MVSDLAHLLSNSLIDWFQFQALLSSRLIALDKSPGVRSIGIGETLGRIMGKAVCLVTWDVAKDICASKKLCTGLQCGIECTIHAATDLSNSHDDSYGMLTVEAKNAFNTINRSALLWNIRVLWPHTSRFIFNTYRNQSPLILKGSTLTLFSSEGIVQGYPLSMFIYAVASLPIIDQMNHLSDCIQIWYSDDSSTFGAFDSLLTWFKNLPRIGPLFSYFPEPTKCQQVVKASSINSASSTFYNTGVNVVMNCRFLGGCVGDSEGITAFTLSRITGWAGHASLLSDIANNQPQVAYTALTKSLQQQCLFFQRVTKGVSQIFRKIDDVLTSQYIPALFGHTCSATERLLFSLPPKIGGLNLTIPTQTVISS